MSKQLLALRLLLVPLLSAVLLVVGCQPTAASTGELGPRVEFVGEPQRLTKVEPPEEPFLFLPFRQEDAKELKVTSGWRTALDEMPAVLDEEHLALDFEGVKYRRPVVAMADGWAIATFQSGVLRGGVDQKAPYNTLWTDPITGRQGYLGYSGLIVDIVFDATNAMDNHYRAQYFHLAEFERGMEYLPPKPGTDVSTLDGKIAKVYTPESKDLRNPTLKRTRVKAGDIIGYIGDSGINFGYDDAIDPASGVVRDRDRKALPPWDPQGAGVAVALEDAAQLHLEVFIRDADGVKQQFDPLDLYTQAVGAPGSVFQMGPRPAFKHAEGRLLFAA